MVFKIQNGKNFVYKIVVYLSGHQGIINFGMLKKLQEIIPIKIYAIIDQGQESKGFYQKQKFVKFEKIWHYTDYVKPFHKPDVKYLKKIEDEFRINLWQIAYSDPTFFAFEGKSNFKEDEILSLVENDCRLF
jgi:lipopolysaccharide biosynthesis glycosyltransferase